MNSVLTPVTSLLSRNIKGLGSAFLFALILTGCEIDGSDNLVSVPDQGLFMYTEANRHLDEDEAQIAAAVFKDGAPVNLVAGDVFEARTLTERVLLTDRGLVTGSYAASLPIDDSVQEVFFNIVHAPIEAREPRWYPIDLINIDPGPGELVGKSAAVSFPPAVTITGPAEDTVYTSINDSIDLSWVAIAAGDNMRVLSAVECTNGFSNSSYGTVVEIGDDDGFEAISMDQFIYDLNVGSSTLKFISDAALMLLQELLNDLSGGAIDPNFVLKSVEANPIESACEIRLFLQRQRRGDFDVVFDDGAVFGARSAELRVAYISPLQAN